MAQQVRTLVPLNQHPANLDPTAALVSGPRERLGIYRVRGGFVATLDGVADLRIFATEQEARLISPSL